MIWRHYICTDCWKDIPPKERPEPLQTNTVHPSGEPWTCCFCGYDGCESVAEVTMDPNSDLLCCEGGERHT